MTITSFKSLSKKPFVIFAYARTGSNLLVSLLDQFPGIHCYGEVFRPDGIGLPKKMSERLGFSVEARNAEPLVFLKRLFKFTPNHHAGFKFFPNHHAGLGKWIANSDSINRVIILRNPFDVYVSLSRARSSGIWVDKVGISQDQYPSMKFDQEQFENFMRFSNAFQTRMRGIAERQPDTTMTISYEEIAAIEPVRGIAGFLGASAQPEVLKVSQKKQTTARYSELFEDFDKVLSYISTHHPEITIKAEKI